MIDYKDLYLNDPEFHALVEIASAGVMNYFKNNPSLTKTTSLDRLNDQAKLIAFSVGKELHKAYAFNIELYKDNDE